jgi:hypothetical protein
VFVRTWNKKNSMAGDSDTFYNIHLV